ncbi:MAG TPA: methylated-DNA--[protein]-cysteine S-methyltransferase [Dehalococcoidia bacterium]|nr:methylated-DNA--[protein]-cysteine S-methyltransferase [Dehalococcoidia bacterium]
MVVGGTERGLRFLTLPRSYRESVLDGNEGLFRDAVEDSSVFGDLPLRLQRYFDGEKVTFPDTLDFSEATAFQETVWGETRSISYGEVKSYSWLARQIGKPQACRAVGRALARNRLPIIVPCHRVVASDGGLGGFSGGLWLKRRLLELEAGRL